jgi:hypothetical protein
MTNPTILSPLLKLCRCHRCVIYTIFVGHMHGVKLGFWAALSIVLEKKYKSNVASYSSPFSVLHQPQTVVSRDMRIQWLKDVK